MTLRSRVLRSPVFPNNVVARLSINERWQFWLLLGLGLIQGLFYVWLMPPWQHYDEQNHFEYAWLLANRGILTPLGEVDSTIRREIAGSLAQYRFHGSVSGTFLNNGTDIQIGIDQWGHPRGYYALVSIPLEAVRYLDVVSQLYVARLVSVALFLVTIAIAIGMMRDLTPPRHPLRLAVPLSLILLPPFVDIMTAVNNDVGAITIFSFFLWGAVRTIRYGITWKRLMWLAITTAACLVTKNTVFVAIVCLPVVLVVAFCVRHPWAWRWAIGAVALMAVLGNVALFSWGDAAYWYRRAAEVQMLRTTSEQHAATPFGNRAFTLVASPNDYPQQLVYPLSPALVNRLAGQTVTIGGWIWAERPTSNAAVGLGFNATDSYTIDLHTQPMTITTAPTFFSQTISLPLSVRAIQYTLQITPEPTQTEPLYVFLDGAFLAQGSFISATAPHFDNNRLTRGAWGDQRFANLIRNASAEELWPQPRRQIEQIIARYSRHSPAQFLLALLDVQRTGSTLLFWSLPTTVDGLVENFAWSQIKLAQPWTYAFRGFATLAVLGCCWWFFQSWSKRRADQHGVILFLAGVTILIWSITVVRPMPMLDVRLVVPVARYSFPVIIPTMLMLAGGWWALWPQRIKQWALESLIVGLLVINVASIVTIVTFYHQLYLPG